MCKSNRLIITNIEVLLRRGNCTLPVKFSLKDEINLWLWPDVEDIDDTHPAKLSPPPPPLLTNIKYLINCAKFSNSFLSYSAKYSHMNNHTISNWYSLNDTIVIHIIQGIKYCVFSLRFCDSSELCEFCFSAGFLPAWCVYTLTQYLMNTLYV